MGTLLTEPVWDVRCDFEGMSFCFSRCKTALSRASQSQIVESLHEGMDGYNIRQYFSRQPAIFSDYDLLVLAVERPTDRPVGILGGRWFQLEERQILYVWTAFVTDAHRGTQLFKEMMALFVGAGLETVPDLVSMKTFSPKVYQLVARFGQYPGIKLYPQIPAVVQDPMMMDLAGAAMAKMFPKLPFFPDTGLVLGGQESVGVEVFPAMPKTADRAVMEHFERHVSPADQIFVLLALPKESTQILGQICGILSPRVAAKLGERVHAAE